MNLKKGGFSLFFFFFFRESFVLKKRIRQQTTVKNINRYFSEKVFFNLPSYLGEPLTSKGSMRTAFQPTNRSFVD